MRVCPTRIVLLACTVLAACHESSSSTTVNLMASSRIGPEGGLVVVQGGQQDGLVLEIPPGVFAEPVAISVAQGAAPIVSPDPAAAAPQLVGFPFVIEPSSLVMATECRLRVPYQPSVIEGTGPGNVVVHGSSPTLTRRYAPNDVSVADGWVEVGIRRFGRFQAEVGDRADSLLDYTPTIDLVVPLTDGFQFVVNQDPVGATLTDPAIQQWRLTGPAFDESVVFLNGEVLGRRSVAGLWLEEWGESYDPYQTPEVGFAVPQPLTSLVHAPLGVSANHGSLMAFGSFVYTEPIEFNGSLELDVIRLTLDVAYNRFDLGAGERRMDWWLSPRSGLLRVAVDGQVYERLY